MSNIIDSDIIIVGGGAAGMMAAITAGRTGRSVILLEAGERVGKKILSTGNGKCNLSHTDITSESYYGSGKDKVERFFNMFSTDDTVRFFASAGMFIRNKDGYLYPYSEQAQSVLDTLRVCLDQANITTLTDTKVCKIEKVNNLCFEVKGENGKVYKSSKVIIATGGKSYPKTGSDGSGFKLAVDLGHDIVKLRPALGKVICDSPISRIVDGVRAKANVELIIDGETVTNEYGEVQFTKDGLSGIPIFNISRLISYAVSDKKKISINLDLVPEYTHDELISFYRNKNNKDAESKFGGIVNKKLNLAILNLCKIKSNAVVSDDRIVRNYCEYIKRLPFEVSGVYGFDTAQVTAGGIDFSQIDDDLQSKSVEGLYFAGEMLDIDGICGGYNLQWAWTSGYIAACGACK